MAVAPDAKPRIAPLQTRTDLPAAATRAALSPALRTLLGDMLALCVTSSGKLAELRADNVELTARRRARHDLCDEHGEVGSAGLQDRRPRGGMELSLR